MKTHLTESARIESAYGVALKWRAGYRGASPFGVEAYRAHLLVARGTGSNPPQALRCLETLLVPLKPRRAQ